MWKVLWTGVRLPSPPPIINLFELQIQKSISKMVDFFVLAL